MEVWKRTKKVKESDFSGLPLEAAWLIAQRASARALPLVTKEPRYLDVNSPFRTGLLCSLRSLLVAETQVWDPSYRVELAAREATVRATEYVLARVESSRLASEAAFSCTRMINRHTSLQPVTSARAWTSCRIALQALKLEKIDANKAVFNDISAVKSGDWRSILGIQLWAESDELWDEAVEEFLAFLTDDKYWRFWNRWYASTVFGQPTNRHLLRKVAITEPHVWKYSEENFDDVLVSLQEEFLFSEIILPERVVRSSETGLHSVIPYEYEDQRKLENAMKKVQDAVEEIRNSSNSNMYAALEDVINVLDRTYEKYLHEPLRVHDDFVKCAKMVRSAIASNELPQSDLKVNSLFDDLTNGFVDIQSGDSFVSKVVGERAKLRFRSPTEEEAASIDIAVEARAKVSDEQLREYLEHDRRVLSEIDSDGLHATLSEPELSAYRLAARLPKIRPQSTAEKTEEKPTTSRFGKVADQADKAGKIMRTAESGGTWIDYFLSLFG